MKIQAVIKTSMLAHHVKTQFSEISNINRALQICMQLWKLNFENSLKFDKNV